MAHFNITNFSIIKLKLKYIAHLMLRADSFEKTLMLEKIEARRRRGQQKMRRFDGITDLMHMSLSKLQEFGQESDGQGSGCAAVHGVAESDCD